MAQGRIDPSDQIPEADLLEQQVPLDPPLNRPDYGEGVADAPVDEGDRFAQLVAVPIAEDDYPHDGFEAGWS